MPPVDTWSRGLCYFRNLVARAYREVRYLGTTGKYDPFSGYYSVCKRKLVYRDGQRGRTWVKPVFDEVRGTSDPAEIESAFSRRLDGLSLDQILEAFEKGSWTSSTGGQKWAAIVRATIELRAAMQDRDDDRITRAVQTIDGLQHNTRRVVEDFLEKCGGSG